MGQAIRTKEEMWDFIVDELELTWRFFLADPARNANMAAKRFANEVSDAIAEELHMNPSFINRTYRSWAKKNMPKHPPNHEDD